MSLKVYNAYISSKSMSLNAILEILIETRKVMTGIAKQAYLEQHTRQIYRYADMKHIGAITEEKSPNTLVREEEREARDNLNRGYRDPSWDFESTVSVLPKDDRIILNPFIDNNKMREAFDSMLFNYGFVDYHYQNQTDPDDNVTEADWKEREEYWENIFREYHCFSDFSFSFGLTDHFGYSVVKFEQDSRDFVKQYCEDIEARKTAILSSFISMHCPKDVFRSNNVSDYMNWYNENKDKYSIDDFEIEATPKLYG